MSKYDNYAAWGFTNNPFLVTALQADVRGQRLLAGRDEEVMTIARKLLRWVFCGANGVIHSLAASPRLSAFLNTPVIDVANIHPKYLGPLIESRTREFAPEYERAYLPINIEDMQWLYMLLNHNLRESWVQ